MLATSKRYRPLYGRSAPRRATKRDESRRSATMGGALGEVLTSLSDTTGIHINERSALTLTAAFACINVIATDVASLPLQLKQRAPDGATRVVADRPVAGIYGRSPDGVTTPMRHNQALMGHVLGWGNGYNEIVFNGAGEPVEVHQLDPAKTRPVKMRDGVKLFYEIDGGKTLPKEKVLHVAGLGFDGLVGYSPVRMARQAIALGKAAEFFGGSFFGNGSKAGGFLKTPKRLTPEARANLRKSFERTHRGAFNAQRMAVLEEGMEFVKTSIDPEDGQFLVTRQFQVLEIARIWRCPPHKIGDYSQAHLANLEQSNLDYVITTVLPWCEQIEQAANLRLLSEQDWADGYYFEHLLTALLRGDSAARVNYYRGMRDLGVMNPDGIAAAEGMNPLPNGQGKVYLVQGAMVPLDRVGKPRNGSVQTVSAVSADAGKGDDAANDKGAKDA